MYIGRFAPTPSGPLHFGSLVAALGSWLDARAHGGHWFLRIEDIDTPRCMPGAVDIILRQLEAHGLTWDGEVVFQSARHEAHRAAADELVRRGWAYPCQCSRTLVHRQATRIGREGPIYPGTCRLHPPLPGQRHALRLMTDGAYVTFIDRRCGPCQQDLAQALGDFVIWRVENIASYHLAVVVDDAWQGVTHVVRGADLLDSTPRQIWLQHLLRLPIPRYLHLPLALAHNGQKLSKQNLAPALRLDQAPSQLVQALTFLGHPPPPELEHATCEALLTWAVDHWQTAAIPGD